MKTKCKECNKRILGYNAPDICEKCKNINSSYGRENFMKNVKPVTDMVIGDKIYNDEKSKLNVIVDKKWKDWGDRNVDTLDMARRYCTRDYTLKKDKKCNISHIIYKFILGIFLLALIILIIK